MPLVQFKNVGQIGVNSDLSAHELPINAWTDASNIRFLDGFAYQFYGHSEVYGTPSAIPQHILPCAISSQRYWIYATSSKCYAVTNSGGVTTTTDITHATPRTGVVNQWTSTLLSGIPILNTGDTSKVPMYWDLNLANKFVDLPNWTAGTYCKSLRSYKNYLVALGMTIAGTSYPYMVKWSHPADPGSLPSSWDITDATKDAGQTDIAEGQDIIVDGLQLRDSFMIYKENSIWRMDFVGGQYVMKFTKVLGNSGALNRNCIVEVDGFHVVLTGQDIIVHDGQTATSVLDKQTRRFLFQNIDSTNVGKCFVFKNTFFNEVFICYPSPSSSVCDKAVVWNYKDKTVTFRSLPNVNHASFGSVDNSLNATFDSDPDTFNSDLTTFDGLDLVPATARVILASNDQKLFLLDGSASFNGTIPSAYLERQGLSFDAPQNIKLVKGIRPRIKGNLGETVQIQIGSSNDPFVAPTYSTVINHSIGSTVADDCFISGRYISIKFSTGSAYQWRLDSFDLDIEICGKW